MDLICFGCGEPWEMDFVLHDEPHSFNRTGGMIYECPACVSHKEPILSKEQLQVAEQFAQLMGDDIDGYASSLQDAGITN